MPVPIQRNGKDNKMNEITIYEAQQLAVKTSRGNYEVAGTNGTALLKREVDFGVIPGTKKPSLYKAGAEKVANACGMLQHYSIETKIENTEEPLFFYTVKCELCKISNDGKEYVFYTGYGSANTKERRNGKNGAFDAANATLKMAVKRSLVAAVISMGGLSDLFTQDMENEDYVKEGMEEARKRLKDNDPITNNQGKLLIVEGTKAGMRYEQMTKFLAENGYPDMKKITQVQFDDVLALLKKAAEK